MNSCGDLECNLCKRGMKWWFRYSQPLACDSNCPYHGKILTLRVVSRCLQIKPTLRESIWLLVGTTTKSGTRSGSLYMKFLLLHYLVFCTYPGKMLPIVLNCIVLCVTKYKSPPIFFFFSCTISMVMLEATAAIPSHIFTEEEPLGFPGTIYAS